MENSERQPFDDNWQQAFRDSEASHSEKVWLSIENALTGVENNENKRKVVYYQRLAAALLLLCVASILITYWQWDDSSSRSLATVEISGSKSNNVDAKDANSSGKNGVENSSALNSISAVDKGSSQMNMTIGKGDRKKAASTLVSRNTKSMGPDTSISSSGALLEKSSDASKEQNSLVAANAELKAGNESIANTGKRDDIIKKTESLTEEEEKELVQKMLGEPEKDESEQVKIPKPSWVSIGASGGGYSSDAPAQSVSSPAFLDAVNLANSSGASNQVAINKPSKIGTSYSVGIMFGKQVSKRWLVQTGLTYMNRRLDYESNLVTGSGQKASVFSPDAILAGSVVSYSFTNPYTVTSTSEFISVPVQLGFILIDRKVSWMVNTGVASDIFLRNTLVDQSGTYQRVSQGEGADVAFQRVSWAGLASTEVSVKLAEHYRFALVPGLRYSFTNVVKDEVGTNKPLILDVGFRFRYIFK